MVEPFLSYRIEERSYVSYLKREIHQKVSQKTFAAKERAEIDIIVAELTSNLIKYAGHGEILYRIYTTEAQESIFEIVCIDKGPGIADLDKMKVDGISSARSLGQGLGAIERLSTLSQVYSVPNAGTVAYSMVSSQKRTIRQDTTSIALEINAVVVSKPREIVCGDGYFVKEDKNELQLLFADGLGHGPFAKEAVDKAGEIFLKLRETDPVDILRRIHEGVKRTRGMVATSVVCDKRTNLWRMCGIGNILTRLYTGVLYKNNMSYNGTVGLNIPTSMKCSSYEVEKNQHLVMCSDGISTRWDLNKYPAVFKYNDVILSSCIYRDFNRGTDDASVVILKVC